jgi:hypothetical protein
MRNRRFYELLVVALMAVVPAGECAAAFTTAMTGGTSASFSSNVDGEDETDDRRYEVDQTTLNRGQSVVSTASASGLYDFPGNFKTACLRNDGVTPCDGREGPGESYLIYTTPDDYVRRSGGAASAVGSMLVDAGVIRAQAISDWGGAVQVSTPVPTNPSQLYERPVYNKDAFANLSGDVRTRTVVHGPPGVVGHITVRGLVEGSIVGNGKSHHDPYDSDPLRSVLTGRAGARFLFTSTSWITGYLCSDIRNGCPGKSVTFKFGAETSPLRDNTENGSYSQPFSLTVDVVDGFVLQTWMSLSAYASQAARARFGNTARIDTLEVSEGFTLDLGDGDLMRTGDTYTFVPTLDGSTTTTTTLAGSTTTTTTLAGPTTTTTTLAGPTTTTLPGCAALTGLAAVRCSLRAALAQPLCGSEAIPSRVDRALRQRLGRTAAAVERAIDASGRSRVRLVRRAGAALDATALRSQTAARAKNPNRAISATCAASVSTLVSSVRQSLANSAVALLRDPL